MGARAGGRALGSRASQGDGLLALARIPEHAGQPPARALIARIQRQRAPQDRLRLGVQIHFGEGQSQQAQQSSVLRGEGRGAAQELHRFRPPTRAREHTGQVP